MLQILKASDLQAFVTHHTSLKKKKGTVHWFHQSVARQHPSHQQQ